MLALYMLTNKPWKDRVINSDARGYYAFLPSFILQQDLSLIKNAAVEDSSFSYPQLNIYLKKNEAGESFNKYSPGSAILFLPFFLIAVLISLLVGTPLTGYTLTFKFIMSFVPIVYIIISIYLLRKILFFYLNDEKQANKLTFLFYAGSALLFYTFYYPLYSHIPAFTCLTWVVYEVIKLQKKFTIKHVALLAVACALTILIRPINGVAFFALPMLFVNKISFIHFIKQFTGTKFKYLIAFIIAFIPVISIAPIIWKLQTGHWFLYTYPGEGFNFSKPFIIDTLFSFRTGVFIHAPWVLVSVVGSILFFRKNLFQLISFLIYFSILTYVTASWWCWDYAGSFGHRAYLDHYVFIIIPLIYWLKYFNYKKIFTCISILIICYNLLRIEQCYFGIIDKTNFNRESFFTSLLYIHPKHAGEFNQPLFCEPYGKITNEWYIPCKQKDSILKINKDVLYSGDFEFTMPLDRKPNRNYGFVYTIDKKRNNNELFNEVYVVFEGRDTLSNYLYYEAVNFYRQRYEAFNKWETFQYSSFFLDDLTKINRLKFYIWNKSGKTFEVRRPTLVLREYTF